MAKNKKVKAQSYFFMSVDSDEINVNSAGSAKALSAAFAHLIVTKEEESAIYVYESLFKNKEGSYDNTLYCVAFLAPVSNADVIPKSLTIIL